MGLAKGMGARASGIREAMMRPMARSPLSYFLPFVLILLTGCGNDTPTSATSMGGGQATAPFSFSVTVAGQIRLRLEAINGTVDIAGSTSANTVSVTGFGRVRSDSTARSIWKRLMVGLT